MNEAPINTTVDTILTAKERKGLRLQYILRVLGGVTYGIAVLIIGTGALEITVTFILMGLYIIAALTVLRFLCSSERLLFFNLLGIGLDLLWLITVSVLLYVVMDPTVTPFSFILKTYIYPFSILFLMFHMISFQPLVVLISGSLLLLFNTTLLLLSIYIQAPGLTTDMGAAFTSYMVNIDFELGKVITFVFIAATAYFINRRNRKTIYESARAELTANQLGRYFSPNVSAHILQSGNNALDVGGRNLDVAVLFSDLVDFTTLSEQREPQEVLDFLTQYHERMVETIFRHNGSLDKFIGDAIMATFGVPEPSEDDASNAVAAALAMNQALAELNDQRRKRGEFEIKHRIGIHYGTVLAGNIGTQRRLEYTVIGDTVNLASRIEQACKELDRSLLVSGAVKARAGHLFEFEKPTEIEVKGRTGSITVHALRTTDG